MALDASVSKDAELWRAGAGAGVDEMRCEVERDECR